MRAHRQSGITIPEVAIACGIGGALLFGLIDLTDTATQTHGRVAVRSEMLRSLRRVVPGLTQELRGSAGDRITIETLPDGNSQLTFDTVIGRVGGLPLFGARTAPAGRLVDHQTLMAYAAEVQRVPNLEEPVPLAPPAPAASPAPAAEFAPVPVATAPIAPEPMPSLGGSVGSGSTEALDAILSVLGAGLPAGHKIVYDSLMPSQTYDVTFNLFGMSIRAMSTGPVSSIEILSTSWSPLPLSGLLGGAGASAFPTGASTFVASTSWSAPSTVTSSSSAPELAMASGGVSGSSEPAADPVAGDTGAYYLPSRIAGVPTWRMRYSVFPDQAGDLGLYRMVLDQHDRLVRAELLVPHLVPGSATTAGFRATRAGDGVLIEITTHPPGEVPMTVRIDLLPKN